MARGGSAMGPRFRRDNRRAAFRGPAPAVIAPRTLATLVAFALAGILLVAFLYTIRSLLTQLLAASVLAMCFEPMVRAMERRGVGRAAAAVTTFALFLVAIVAFAYALLPPLVEGFAGLVREAPDFLAQLGRTEPVASLDQQGHIVDRIRTWWIEQGGARLVGPPTLRFAKGILDTGAGFATVSFLSLFLLLSGGQWFGFFLEFVPQEMRPLWRRLGDGVSQAVGGYVSGNLFISVIAGTVAAVVLLVTRVPYALPLGLVVAVFDLIPMFGATLAIVIVALVALSRGIATTAIVIAALWLYQIVENHVLTQTVYHGTVKLSALATTVSIAIGTQLGGIAGTLMAIPAAGALKVALGELLAWRRGRRSPAHWSTPGT